MTSSGETKKQFFIIKTHFSGICEFNCFMVEIEVDLMW